MDMKQLLEVQSNDCKNPTFFCDYDTEELLYLNAAMEKKFQIFEDYSGKKASNVIPYYEDICGFSHKSELKEWEYLEKTFLSEMLNANLRSKSMLWNIHGRKVLQTKYFLAPTNDKRKEAEVLFEKAIARCLEILSHSDSEHHIDSFLELLCEFYGSKHTYICEFDANNNTVSKSYIHSMENGYQSFPENPNVSVNRFIEWLDSDHNKSIINLDRQLHNFINFGIEESLLNDFTLENITISKLWDKDGGLMGIVGMTNRADLMYDDRLLQAVSHFVMEQFSLNSMSETLANLNEIDLLTGFFTREKYIEKYNEIEANPPKSLGVLVVNMNGLRITNEFLGYEAGDEQLKKTSAVLSEYFYDSFYRVTGDEFIGFVADCTQDIFEDTVNSLQNRLKEQSSEATFSFGHCWEEGYFVLSDVIKVADTVMVINKQSYYAETLTDSEKMTNAMLQDLFRAIAEEEFLVYLQPQINLKTEEISGAEALIRRYDKNAAKMIFPDQFIPLYEKNSVIRHVDLFVLRKVCQILQTWKLMEKTVPVSVNLSRVTLLEYGIVDTITEIVDSYHIPHELIIMEITERVGLIENDVATSLVDAFKENGFKLSLDDFGCAYSNIVSLAEIDIDEVKIDKSLVDKLLLNGKNRIIVKNILSMCHELDNTSTLAEGIETKGQAEVLKEYGCGYGQGYYYSRPIPNEEFTEQYIKTKH